MVSKKYFLLFKTADAEKRAWKNLDDEYKESIFPIVELSRGRKIRGKGKDSSGKNLPAEQLLNTKGVYGFDKSNESIINSMSVCEQFFVDLTREPSLSCYEIEHLSASVNGYSRWVNFMISLKAESPGALPTLIVNPSEDESEEDYLFNLKKQFSSFTDEFAAVAYRASVLEDEEFLYDLFSLKEEIKMYCKREGAFYLFLDHEFIRPGNGETHSGRTSSIISSILAELPEINIVVLATSFPKYVTDIGDEEHEIFRIEEMFLYEKIKETYSGVLYGDYGSINPIRNDEVVMARGWCPRIDFVTRNKGLFVYYFREKRDVIGQTIVNINGAQKKKNILAPYSRHYASVAKKVVNFKPNYEQLMLSWGARQIEMAASGSVPSNSPSHWISVRMEIHIIQVLNFLKDSDYVLK